MGEKMKYKNFGENETINLVFLGCGNIVKKHVKTIRSVDKKIDLSFASRSIEKAQAYQEQYAGKYAFGTYQDAIADQNIDVVFVTTPPNSHYELTKAALEAGKHVIVEKPPFFKSSDIEELGALADQNNLQLMIAENYFYKPMRREIKKLLDSDIIGKPLFMNISATKKQKSKNDWREDQNLTGFGALFEGGIHWVNFINNIGLDINQVYGFRPIKEGNLEKSMQLTATTTEGTIINLLYSWEVDTMFFGLRLSRIYGTEGSITFESNGLSVFTRGRRKKLRFPKLGVITGFKPMFTDFFVSLRAGKQAEFNYQKAKEDLALIEKAYASLGEKN